MLTEAEKFRIQQALARDASGRPTSAKLRRALEIDQYARALLKSGGSGGRT